MAHLPCYGPHKNIVLNKIRAYVEALRPGGKFRPRIVFLHLPRTGGTALVKDILFANFPKSRWCHVNFGPAREPLGGAHDPLSWSAWRRGRIGLLAGHMPFGFAEHFPGPSEYVTLVRDPIERVISDYHFCRRNPSNPAHEAAIALSLREFVERGYTSSQNCYARWLSNAVFGAKFHDQNEMLPAAMNNLAQFSFIGITEQFDLSVERLCRRYGLAPRPTSEANRNDATPQERHVSAEEHEVLRRSNQLDLVIYAECQRRFSGLFAGGSAAGAGL